MADVEGPLIPPRLLFRVSVPCLYKKPLWSAKGTQLGEEHRLLGLHELEGRPTLGDIRFAWSEEGIGFQLRVQGKRKPAWCHPNRMDGSDGLQIWIDTRDTHNIHRASRFCHRFAFLPAGGGRMKDQPVADQLLIDRARENPNPVRPDVFKIRSEKRVDGYLLEGLVPAEALTGFDPEEHPKLGFTYAIMDHERGEQTFTVGNELPYDADPSLWGTLELTRGMTQPDPKAVPLTLPDLGMGDEPATISVWLTDEGQQVVAGDRIVEILAGHATIDLPSPVTGTLVKHLASVDQRVFSGQELCRFAVEADGDGE